MTLCPSRDPALALQGDAARLLHFNRQLLDQALALVSAHEAPSAPPFADQTGPHLRHVIEHYEALVLRGDSEGIDYDRRSRDRAVENDPALARVRIVDLQKRLSGWSDATLDVPLRLGGQAGTVGEFEFAVASSVGRELVFLASHAVHHFAVLHVYCLQHGLIVDADLGRAPATLAHERHARHQPADAAHAVTGNPSA
jgi:hypothetical protein